MLELDSVDELTTAVHYLRRGYDRANGIVDLLWNQYTELEDQRVGIPSDEEVLGSDSPSEMIEPPSQEEN